MENIILIISENTGKKSLIEKVLINSHYRIKTVNKSKLMISIVNELPSIAIVDLDSYQGSSLQLIQSTISVEYLPTICMASTADSAKKKRYIDQSVLITTDQLSSLTTVIEQAIVFSEKYNDLKQNYDVIDLMNRQFQKTLKYYVRANKEYENEIILQYLKNIYFDNIFLNDKPKGIWIIDENDTNAIATLFLTKDDRLIYKTHIQCTSQNLIQYNDYDAIGFFKNIETDEMSDIDNITVLIPENLLSIYTPIKNIAGFSNDTITGIAFDYNEKVTQHQVDIIKDLVIKINIMKSIKYSINEVKDSYVYTLNALARAAEAKDDVTGQHIKRVNEFSKILAQELKMDTEFINDIYISAQMHDVGKIYVDERILLKPGKLTKEEFEEIKKHTIYGEDIIGDSSHLSMSAQIARCHHEKFDGSGYPYGIKGEEIPIAARIVSLVDIYDALRSKRPYKPGFTHEQAYDIIVTGDGRVEPSHFDPIVLEAFKNIHLKFKEMFVE